MRSAGSKRGVWRRLVASAALAAVASGAGSAPRLASALVPQPQGTEPPGAVDIASISNGCGGGSSETLIAAQNAFGDTSVYRDSFPYLHRYKVDFREACNLHDAGYSGALVWDSINGRWYDYFGKTKEEVDQKFLADMRKLCDEQIPADAPVARADCRATGGTTSNGAESRYNFVRDHGTGYRDRPKLDGLWKGTSGSCGTVGNWKFSQSGRTITASWQQPTENGQPGYTGSFTGTLYSYDPTQTVPPPRNDEIKGTLTVVKGSNSPKTYQVDFELSPSTSRDPVRPTLILSYFGGTYFPEAPPGLMPRVVQSAAVCRLPLPKQTPPTATTTTAAATAAGTFVLDTSLTKVSNPNANELTITPTATGQALDDHTGPNGGAGNGGDWKVEYHWAVPTTLVPGKTAAIYLQIVVDSENPPQPNGYQMSALAPDFAEALPCHYPEQTSCSQTFQYPLAADQAGSKEIGVSIHMLSAEVDFTYRPGGK